MMRLNSTKSNEKLTLGYNLDMWSKHKIKIPITTDISPKTNSHMIIAGMSGGGKSFAQQLLFAKLTKHGGTAYFADYKGDDSYKYLKGCPHYYSYNKTLNALDEVYAHLQVRLSGSADRFPVTLLWDEYVSNMLALMNEDKKLAAVVMNKVAEILQLGRSMSVRLIQSCQRPDALVYPAGSRLNFGIMIIVGAAVRSIYEILIPDFLNMVNDRRFNRGEGVAVLQGSALHFIKIPVPNDYEKMQKLCIKALS